MASELSTHKKPMPGWGVAVIDTDKENDADNFGAGAQVGKLIALHESDKQYNHLLNKTIYWRAYAEADGRFYDDKVEGDVIFVSLEKIMGHED